MTKSVGNTTRFLVEIGDIFYNLLSTVKIDRLLTFSNLQNVLTTLSQNYFRHTNINARKIQNFL